jgi:biotin transport system substrate-specific component
MTAIAAPVTPLDRLWPRTAGSNALRNATLVILATGLLALSGHIQVPFWPVKLSLQTLVVLAIGIAYGSRLGGATILAYLIEGALGLPVFQGGAGIAYMVGPTGGFLLGFVLAAVVIGLCAERGMLNRFPAAIAAVLLAEAAIYIPGVAWLAVLFGPAKSIAFGLTPFLMGEALKIGLVLALVPAIRRVMH